MARACRIGLAVALALATGGLYPATTAQAVTFVEQANRLQLIFAFLLDLRPGRPPRVAARDTLSLAVELIPIPAVDTRVGRKDEPIDPPPAIPRFRALFSHASGLSAGGTVSPPVEVLDYTAPWLGLEAGYGRTIGPAHAELRAFGIYGYVEGPISEPGSKDRLEFFNRGADLRLGLPYEDWMGYAGLGRGTTTVVQTIAADGARIALTTDYGYLLAGIARRWGPWEFTFEQNRTEDFLDHVILAGAYRF